jgi:hypothetical protein
VNAKIGAGIIGRLGVAGYLDPITAAGVKVNMRAKSRCTLSTRIAARCARWLSETNKTPSCDHFAME